MRKLLILVACVFFFISQAAGMVMNENTDELPSGCDQINGWENITVHGGKEHAKQFNGKMFTYDERNYEFDPCTKLTVTFVNNDSVRHQWMVHGLPEDIYNMGMFSIEVTDGRDTGTFILPSHTETLKVHCGVPQHEQKGMKGQLKINGGDGNLPNIPGITDVYDKYDYPRESILRHEIPFLIAGFIVSLGTVVGYRRYQQREENDG